MKFDIWTFTLQITNFTVLLFILRRLLYKPVREMMEKRRALAAQTMEQAETARKEAEELKTRNQAELKQFQLQRVQLLEDMKGEIAQERLKMLEDAQREARRLIEKEQSLFAAEKKRYGADLRDQAIDAVGLFAENICRDIADEELHRALFRRLLSKMEQIVGDLRDMSRREGALGVEVASAYPLTAEEERSLRDALETGVGREVSLATTTDRELMAGMKVKAYDMIYDSSLRGQLTALNARLKESA